MARETRSSSTEMPFGVAVIFTMVGIGLFLGSLLGWIGPALWVRFAYRPAVATVLQARPTEKPTRGGTRYGLEAQFGFSVGDRGYRPWVALPRASRMREGPEADAVRRQLTVGEQVDVFHDPYRPASGVVLERARLEWSMLLGVVFPLVFLAVGASGMAASWTRTFPRGARAELAEVARRLPRRFYLHLLDATAIGVAGAVWLASAPRGILGVLGLLGAIAAAVVMFHRAARAGAVAWPSPERLAARGRAAGHPSAVEKKPAPTRPEPASWSPTPVIVAGRGERLAIRLRPAREIESIGTVAGVMLFAVMVGGMVGLGLLEQAGGGRIGRLGSSARKVAIATVVVAAAATAVASGLRTARRVRGLALEISKHPLRPGGRYEVALFHRDLAELARLRLTMNRQEEATTTDRRGGKGSFRDESDRATAMLDRPDKPGGLRRGHLDVPADTVPSLAMEHHWVEWSLAVRLGGPFPFGGTVHFPVTVVPRAAAQQSETCSSEEPRAKPADGPGTLWLDGGSVFPPGAMLAGGYSVEPVDGRPLKSVELSVLWETESSGRRELGVGHYEDRAAVDGDERPLLGTYLFHARLPAGPPSHRGSVVRIHWRVRLRLRHADGGETLREAPFSLGGAGR